MNRPPKRTPGKETRRAAEPAKPPPARGFRFGPVNYATFAAGLAAIVVGYVLLDRGSVTAAPMLLVLGYAVLLPLGLILGWRRLD